MRIGRLRHRVTIVGVATAPDVTGAPTHTTTAGVTVWAEVRTLSGSEHNEPPLERMTSATQFRVTMRYRTGIVPTTELLWQGRRLRVHTIVEPDNRQRVIQLDCSEEL